MALLAAAGAGVTAATVGYLSWHKSEGHAASADQEQGADEPLELTASTWKESAGREHGRDGYVFGDVSRGIYSRLVGNLSGAVPAEADAAEDESDPPEEGEECVFAGEGAASALGRGEEDKSSQVQRLVCQALRVYRARGYDGTITMSHTVGYFTESCVVKVDAEEGASQQAEHSASRLEQAELLLEDSRAGRVLRTLFTRLEKRAQKWKVAEEALEGLREIDPMLSTSAQIGFAVPVIRVGWGVAVSLSISQSSLLRWAAMQVALGVPEDAHAAR